MKNLLLSIVGGFALSGCVGVLHTNESVQQETDSNWGERCLVLKRWGRSRMIRKER